MGNNVMFLIATPNSPFFYRFVIDVIVGLAIKKLKLTHFTLVLWKSALIKCWLDGWYLLGLQDSLGGNSKTTIIATVSPSSWYVRSLIVKCILYISMIFLAFSARRKERLNHRYKYIRCSVILLTTFSGRSNALETLSTLKFAQRAKLIRNTVCFRLFTILLTRCIYYFLTLWLTLCLQSRHAIKD